MRIAPINVSATFWKNEGLKNKSSQPSGFNVDSGKLSELLTKDEKSKFARIANYFNSAQTERQTGELALAFAMDKIMAIKSGRGHLEFNKNYLEHVKNSISNGHGSYSRIEISFIESLLNKYNIIFG